ncbi:MAG: TetR/AcrR family transcriptional regulator [Acidobacteriota bacterium]|nr:TetR/AcrR family transcriptional regulator [Acidobacteriota bacterium]
MSPRPRKVSDDDVFQAAQRAMSRLGPGELTLAEIAAEAGVTAGALVQRFGSKRDLMIALSERFSGGTGEMFVAIRKAHRSPLAALRAYGDCISGLATSPEALARNLSYLQIDLTDPDLRQHLVAQAWSSRRELQAIIRDAVAAGELVRETNPTRLARTVEAILAGSMMSWAYYEEGTAAQWMRDDLEAVLKPYVKPKKKR